MAIGRKTGGRKKGTPNKATAAHRAALKEGGLTPLDFMLNRLRDEDATADDRMEAAKAAAPYLHPRLAAIDHSGILDLVSHERALDELDDADQART